MEDTNVKHSEDEANAEAPAIAAESPATPDVLGAAAHAAVAASTAPAPGVDATAKTPATAPEAATPGAHGHGRGGASKQQIRRIKEQLRREGLTFAQLRQLLEDEVISSEQFEELKAWLGEQLRKQIRRTRALSFYLVKFGFRIAVFAAVLVLYLTRFDWLERTLNQPVFYHGALHVTPLHALWAIFMAIMASHLIPSNRLSMAWRKARENTYQPVQGYDRLQLLEFVQDQNVKAWKVMLAWLSFNAVFGILYLAGVLREGDLFMLTVFYFLSDYICILLFCPFQTFIMKNKCCINCRIYDWGHFMMFTPMLFIRNFFSWSLFFMSVVVVIHWEITYARHPERFWHGSNRTLQCDTCKERTCQIKRRLKA